MFVKGQMSKVKCQSGFTIIELMVVFSIMAVLSGIGFAAFTSYSRSQVLDQAVQDLKTAVGTTKFNSVSSVKPSVCDATTTLNSYQIVFNPAVSPALSSYTIKVLCFPNSAAVISTKVLPASITMVSTGSPPITTCTTISYNTLIGFESPVGGCQVVLSAYGMTKRVVIDGGGNASIQ